MCKELDINKTGKACIYKPFLMKTKKLVQFISLNFCVFVNNIDLYLF